MSLDVRTLIDEVKKGSLSRRAFVQRIVLAGLTAPMATQLLALGGVAHAETASPGNGYAPTKRGGGGLLKTLWWQGPTLLNPHFAIGTKDQDASRLFYQPLASWNEKGELVADPGGRTANAGQWRPGQGRQVGDLEAAPGREVA